MSQNRNATILLLIGMVFWGMTFAFIKEAVQFVDAFSFLFVRFLIASLILAVVFFPKLKNLSRDLIKKGLISGVLLAISIITCTIGLQYTTASNAGFITGLNVILVLIFVAIMDKRIPDFLQVLSVVLAFAGLFLIVVNENLSFNIGDIWVLVCAIAAALHLISVGKLAKKVDGILFALVQLVTVAIICLVLGLFINGEIVMTGDYLLWQAILFCAIFASAYVYTVQAHFQRYLSDVKAAIIFSFEPVFAALFAIIYLGEVLTGRLLVGGLMIFAAMVLSEWDLKKITEKK